MAAWKVMTGIILGLVLQFTQVADGMFTCQPLSAPCGTTECHCCEGKQVCPCAKTADPRQEPAPTVPPVKVDKLDPVLPPQAEPDSVVGDHYWEKSVPGACPPSYVRAFGGVPLRISFCRFLI